MVKQTSIRIMRSLVARFDLKLDQMDVTTALLHGELEEVIYMKQPQGFVRGNEENVCLLKRPLYGLMQYPRQWNKRFDTFMKSIHYRGSCYDSCVYYNGETHLEKHILLLLYMDDILIDGKDRKDINTLKAKSKGQIEMKDMKSARKILGINIRRDRNKKYLFL